MANDELGQRIIRFIQSRNNQTESLSEIVKFLKVSKKTVNAELYTLKRRGVLDKVQESPPIWSYSGGAVLNTVQGAPPDFRTGRQTSVGRGRGIGRGKALKFSIGGHAKAKKGHSSPVDKGVMKRIFDYLSNHMHKPVKTLEIARGIGFSTSGDINNTMYFMCKNDIVRKVNDNPPMWHLALPHGSEMPSLDTAGAVGMLENDMENFEDAFSNRGGMSQSDVNSSRMFDSEHDLNAVATLYNQRGAANLGFDPNIGAVTQSSADDLKIGLDYRNKADSPHSEFDMGRDNNEQEVDTFNSSVNFFNQRGAISSFNSDVGAEMEDVEEETPILENLAPHMLSITVDNDLSHLDSQTKRSVVESCEQILPDEPVPGKDKEEFQDDLGEDSDLEANEAPTCAMDFGPVSDVKLDLVEPHLSPTSVAIKQEFMDRTPLPEMSPGSIPLESLSSDGYVLTDSDKVLKELRACPLCSATSFILTNKVGFSQEIVEGLLKELEKQKYVSFHKPLWILTPSGQAYIESKVSSSSGFGTKSLSNIQPALSPKKPTVHRPGPPPSPHALLQKEKLLSEGPGASPSKLTFNETAPTSGPLPLMSLNFTGKVSTTSVSNVPPQNVATGTSEVVPIVNVSSYSLMNKTRPSYSPIDRLKQAFSQPSSLSSSSSSSLPVGSRTVELKMSSSTVPNSGNLSAHGLFSLSGNMGRPASNTSVNNTSSSSGFKIPQPPLELVRQQLKNTDISHQNDPQRTTLSYPVISVSKYQQQTSSPSPFRMSQPVVLQSGLGLTTSVSSGSMSLGSGLNLQHNSVQPTLSSGPSSLPAPTLGLSSESFAALNKNPVSALMEYAQSRGQQAQIEVISQRGAAHKPVFQMAVFLGSRQFPSITCSNKKDGRKEAADLALRKLIAEGQFKAQSAAVASKAAISPALMTHFDKVAALTHQAFNVAVAGITENFAGRKVIAGLVMKRSPDDVGILLSLGTGNRCITGPQLSLEGNTVNDSHAEIITRRGFIRYLYKQLLQYNPSQPSQLFERGKSGKLRIRQGVTFHLYISTAPCGDGALFSPRDTAANTAPLLNIQNREHNPTFSSNVQGLLRTKVEGGEGTIPIEPNFKGQTWDGILRGERLRTMSCTDKICRWNVVGMQGALLSHFLEPIYLDSLTLGFLYDHGHLARAVCCRVARGDTNIDDMLPPGYHLNHPWLGRVTACDPPRETQKTKALSINWCLGDERAEVTDGTLGLCYTSIEKGMFSRCSKKNLYDSFKKVCQKFGKSDLLNVHSYNEAKQRATDFVQAKEAMLKKFKENGYTVWVSKPVEEEMFN